MMASAIPAVGVGAGQGGSVHANSDSLSTDTTLQRLAPCAIRHRVLSAGGWTVHMQAHLDRCVPTCPLVLSALIACLELPTPRRRASGMALSWQVSRLAGRFKSRHTVEVLVDIIHSCQQEFDGPGVAEFLAPLHRTVRRLRLWQRA